MIRAELLCRVIPWHDGEPHPTYQRVRLCVASLELGLRWLHDRARPALSVYGLDPRMRENPEYTRGFQDAWNEACLAEYHVMNRYAALELGLRWLHDRAHEQYGTAEWWKAPWLFVCNLEIGLRWLHDRANRCFLCNREMSCTARYHDDCTYEVCGRCLDA